MADYKFRVDLIEKRYNVDYKGETYVLNSLYDGNTKETKTGLYDLDGCRITDEHLINSILQIFTTLMKGEVK